MSDAIESMQRLKPQFERGRRITEAWEVLSPYLSRQELEVLHARLSVLQFSGDLAPHLIADLALSEIVKRHGIDAGSKLA